MLRRVTVALAGLTCALIALPASAAAAPSGAGTPVGPHQVFRGLVNGQVGLARVAVVCAPGANSGHPRAGQVVAVTDILGPVFGGSSYGNTGSSADRIAVEPSLFSTGAPGSGLAILTSYGVAEPIPTELNLPCAGTGTFTFQPLPDLTGDAVAATVTVVYSTVAG